MTATESAFAAVDTSGFVRSHNATPAGWTVRFAAEVPVGGEFVRVAALKDGVHHIGYGFDSHVETMVGTAKPSDGTWIFDAAEVYTFDGAA